MLLTDGFPTTLTITTPAGFQATFEEKEVTPPGAQGGGANDTTTMRNTAWRTRRPKKLKTLTPFTMVVAYDPAILTHIVASVNVNQLLTLTHPDVSTWAFWGWIDEFVPNRSTEGAQPTANITVIPSNENNSGVEVAPVYDDGVP